MPTVLRALNPIGVPIAIGDVAGYLAGKVSIENPVPTRASQVSAPTFNASATRACVTSLATLKSDWWPFQPRFRNSEIPDHPLSRVTTRGGRSRRFRIRIPKNWLRHCLRQARSACARERSDEAIHRATKKHGSLHAARHRARIRATRWLAIRGIHRHTRTPLSHATPTNFNCDFKLSRDSRRSMTELLRSEL